MNFKEFLKSNIVILDGGMGTLLQAKGLKTGELPEVWNITHPEEIIAIHRAYFDSGSNIVSTNTFGANILKFNEENLENIIACAIDNAKKAKETTVSTKEKFIALDIGPTGKLLKPLGDLDFEDAVNVFKKTVEFGVKYGVDLVIIETMNDSYETKAALLAVKETCDLPVIVTNAYSENGLLMTGASPEAMVALLEGMGVDALGANCSLGPKQLIPIAEKLLENASVPVVLKPNAGIPKTINGKTYFTVNAEEFSSDLNEIVKKGVRVVGGCCGTTPAYINALNEKVNDIKPVNITQKNKTVVSSGTHTVEFNKKPVLIGERINPTGKKKFKQALIDNDINYILNEALSQQEKGVSVLDVNVGIPDIDEASVLTSAVTSIQSVVNLPLQIDTSNIEAMESALRRYNGKALINSVNGKKESMDAIFPIAKKYGSVIVALTLDENGIPETYEGRVEIAKNILEYSKKFGIDKKNIIFDPLTLTISADENSAITTLKALNTIKNELGCHTVLGVSNVSFGLPNRDAINSAFFALALENGLSGAIMNPYSPDMMKTYYSFNAIKGFDNNCTEYIDKIKEFNTQYENNAINENDKYSLLQKAIINGLKDKAGEITSGLLNEFNPLDIVNNEIIPALNIVGIGFENKKYFLPQLLMSAEAAKEAFNVIKNASIQNENKNDCAIIRATVEGDIHDIGKNIVKLLLENYGFLVYDLGKDVKPEDIIDSAINNNAKIVGLSALMTTTVPKMEETIVLLKEKAPHIKTIVGGAVLTEEYANKIGADYYGKDAMATVRYAQEIIK